MTAELAMKDVCQLSACESDTPCRFGRCTRRWPWRRTPSSILEAVISQRDAALLMAQLGSRPDITRPTRQAINP